MSCAMFRFSYLYYSNKLVNELACCKPSVTLRTIQSMQQTIKTKTIEIGSGSQDFN